CSGLGEEAYCGVDGACRLPCSNDGMCTPTERCDDTGRCASLICFADAECVEEENAVCLLSGQGFEGLCGTPEDVPTCGQGGMGEPNNTDTMATPLMLTDGSLTLADQEVCDDDIDLYRITLDAVSTLRVDINYTGPTDLDLYIVAAGADSPIGLGLSTELTSETAIAEYAPPGEYVIRVGFYSGEDPTATYSMTLSTESVMCEEGTFCAAQTSVLRLVCEEGACVGFEGNGEVALGETCDSNDDCVADADLCYNAEGAALSESNICTLRCFVPGDCAAVEGTTCLTDGTFEDGFCLPDPM
ncbi:MAG: hypothetical protein AAFS10_11020, partial [Myxococcota bacterium]